MTREEIEQAIKNGESVWVVLNEYSYEYDDVKKIDWTKVEGVELHYNYFQYFNGENLCGHYYELIFKTKAEAEHYLHHANVTRTETLPFLTWEEFKEIRQISFIGKDKKEYIFKKDIIWSNNKYTLVDCLKIVNETDFTFSKYFDYTEENFYKAYDECVRLFRGVINANEFV